MRNAGLSLLLLAAIFGFVIASVSAGAIDRESRPFDVDDSDYVLELFNRLGQSIVRANELENLVRRPNTNMKRGLDLGLGRGFSGSQAAKHLMGLAAANFAGGPGRRRRSAEDFAQDHQNSFAQQR